MKRASWLVAQLGVIGLFCACGVDPDPASDLTSGGLQPGSPSGPVQQDEATPSTRPPLGGAREGLTVDQLAAFERGRIVFEHRWTPGEGLGPLYNSVACSSCHSTPVTGGSAQLYRNFYLATGGQSEASQFLLPGLPSLIVPSYGSGITYSLEGGRAVIVDSFGVEPNLIPVTMAQRGSVPIFGVGLFEFVTNATIVAGADPNDSDLDGISGRFNQDSEGVGRFGSRLQTNNIELFTRGPLFNQMGITSEPFEGSGATVSLAFCAQVGSDPNEATFDFDSAPDPEIDPHPLGTPATTTDLGDLIAFTSFLAPPGKLEPFSAAATRGQALFEDVGCTDCHFPSLPTCHVALPCSDVPATIEAYTDLLLHDMGPGLSDGISMGIPQTSSILPLDTTNSPTFTNTTGHEWRTTPLWGVSLSAPYLHDGRAETLGEAIDLHAGEGQMARDAYTALTPAQQADLIEFLEHL